MKEWNSQHLNIIKYYSITHYDYAYTHIIITQCAITNAAVGNDSREIEMTISNQEDSAVPPLNTEYQDYDIDYYYPDEDEVERNNHDSTSAVNLNESVEEIEMTAIDQEGTATVQLNADSNADKNYYDVDFASADHYPVDDEYEQNRSNDVAVSIFISELQCNNIRIGF